MGQIKQNSITNKSDDLKEITKLILTLTFSETKTDETLLLIAQHCIMGYPLNIALIEILLYPKKDILNSLIWCQDAMALMGKIRAEPAWKPRELFLRWSWIGKLLYKF